MSGIYFNYRLLSFRFKSTAIIKVKCSLYRVKFCENTIRLFLLEKKNDMYIYTFIIRSLKKTYPLELKWLKTN